MKSPRYKKMRTEHPVHPVHRVQPVHQVHAVLPGRRSNFTQRLSSFTQTLPNKKPWVKPRVFM